MAALRAAELLAGGLRARDEREARPQLALGALLAGYAVGSAGFALHHVVGQSFVRVTGAPHAHAYAVLLPSTLAAMTERAPRALGNLAVALGHPEPDPRRRRSSWPAWPRGRPVAPLGARSGPRAAPGGGEGRRRAPGPGAQHAGSAGRGRAPGPPRSGLLAPGGVRLLVVLRTDVRDNVRTVAVAVDPINFGPRLRALRAGTGLSPARPRRAHRRLRADAVPGRARRDEPDARGRPRGSPPASTCRSPSCCASTRARA